MTSITPVSSARQVTQTGLADLRVSQAQRNAIQAEQTARALQSQAAGARQQADQARENARSLSVQSAQAQDDAGRARQGVAALQSQIDTLGGLSQRLDIISPPPAAEAASPAGAPLLAESVSVAAESTPVVNTDGQITGTLINVTA